MSESEPKLEQKQRVPRIDLVSFGLILTVQYFPLLNQLGYIMWDYAGSVILQLLNFRDDVWMNIIP